MTINLEIIANKYRISNKKAKKEHRKLFTWKPKNWEKNHEFALGIDECLKEITKALKRSL